jgi:hypothetical protein
VKFELPRDAEFILLRRAANDESPGPMATGLTTLADVPRHARYHSSNRAAKWWRRRESNQSEPITGDLSASPPLTFAQDSGGPPSAAPGETGRLPEAGGGNRRGELVSAQMPTALPAPQATVADLLAAVDQAVLAGDLHRARRLLADASARAAEGNSSRGGRRGNEET